MASAIVDGDAGRASSAPAAGHSPASSDRVHPDPTVIEVATLAAPLVRVKERGYYLDPETGVKYPSVTTILSRSLSKFPLVLWAPRKAAQAAMENLPYLVAASRTEAAALEAYEWLATAPDRIRDERGDLGTAVHAQINARIDGVALPEVIDPDPEIAACLGHFDRFVEDWQVTFTASEMVVANFTAGYAGTFDWLMTSSMIADRLGVDPLLAIAGDAKTGGELGKRGVYGEAALQESAYSHAEFVQTRQGLRVPMPVCADRGIVLHLRPNGYRVLPVDIGPETFNCFLTLLAFDRDWSTTRSKRVIGKALELGGGA